MSNYRFYYKKNLSEGETLDVEGIDENQIDEEIKRIVRAVAPRLIHVYQLPDEGDIHGYIEDDSDLVGRYNSVIIEWVARPDEPGVEDYTNLGVYIDYRHDEERDVDVILKTEVHG